jgi:anti-anti-sigma factor
VAPPAAARIFDVSTTVSGETAVCACTGKLNADTAARFKAEIKDLLPHYARVVLDFTHVVSMDSSGLGAVASLYVSAHSAKCEFQLVNFNQRVRELLGLTKLLSAFETCGHYMIKLP